MVRSHSHHQVDLYLQQGLTEEEARRRARLALGGFDQAKEECRDARGVSLFESVLQDLRYAARALRKSPGFTAVAVLSLAVGIGVNTVMFSLLDQVLVRLLPVKDPEALVLFKSPGPMPGMYRKIGARCLSLTRCTATFGTEARRSREWPHAMSKTLR